MRIAFLVERNLYYKFYGPVVQGLLNEGHEVTLYHLYRNDSLTNDNQKLFYFPFLSQIPAFQGKTLSYVITRHESELPALLRRDGIDAIFSLKSRSYFPQIDRKITWCSLQHGVDNFQEKNFESDYFFVYSKAWIENAKMKIPAHVKVIEVGQYYVDFTLTKDVVAKKYSFPLDQKYLLFCPLPVTEASAYTWFKNPIQRHYAIHKIRNNEHQILRWLKQAADELGYKIIIKSRFKRLLGTDFDKYGYVHYDDSFYPSTVNEFVCLSDLVVSHFGAGAICTETLSYGKKYRILGYSKYQKFLIEYSNAFIPDIFTPYNGKETLYEENHRDLVKLLSGDVKETLTSDYRSTYLWPSGAKGVQSIVAAVGSIQERR